MENVKEESFIELHTKIEDMKKLKASLAREIDQNQLQALDLRESIKALIDKEASIKKSLNDSEATLIKRRDEIASIDNLLDKERKIIDAEKRDLASMREGINGEMAVWRSEKAGALETIEEQRKKLNRIEIDLLNKTEDLKNKEKDIDGQILELSERRTKVKDLEVRASMKFTESENLKKDTEKVLRDSQRALDEAKAKAVSYESLIEKNREIQKSFAEREAHIKTCYNEIDFRKSELDERERDVIIDEDRVNNMKQRLTKEIERSKIDSSKKDVMISQLNEKDSKET